MIDYELLKAETALHPYPLLFATISGGHLYGFPSPDSDFDLRGVHLLPMEEVVGLFPSPETVEFSGWRGSNEIDLVTHDAHKFFSLMLKRNGYVLEQLYSPLIVQSSPEHEELKAMGHKCVTRHHIHHYLGFAGTQWNLFAKENAPGVKPLLYAYRVLLTGIHLIQTGEVEANLMSLNKRFKLPGIKELIEFKTGYKENAELGPDAVEFHATLYQRLRAKLEEAGQNSRLPEEPSARVDLNDLLVRLRLGPVRLRRSSS